MRRAIQPMRTTAIASLVLLAACLAPGISHAELIPMAVNPGARGYEQIAAKDGVTVYKHKTSDIIRLAADARIDAPPEVVGEALLDYRGQIGVIKRLSESRVLSRGKNSLRVYQRLNLPVIDDRDYTLVVRWRREREVLVIHFKTTTEGAPAERKGVVRVPYHEGSWQLRPVDGGRRTLARFMTTIDMGGLLPKWLARSGSGKEVPKVLASVNSMVERRLKPSGRVAWSSR